MDVKVKHARRKSHLSTEKRALCLSSQSCLMEKDTVRLAHAARAFLLSSTWATDGAPGLSATVVKVILLTSRPC